MERILNYFLTYTVVKIMSFLLDFFFIISCTKIRQEHIVEMILKEMHIIVITTSTETFLEAT